LRVVAVGSARLLGGRSLLVFLITLLLASCGSPGPGSATDAAGNLTGADPGNVALRYTRTIFTGNFIGASRYVAPASRKGFLVLADGVRSASIAAYRLAIGSTKVRGSAAVVVLTGTMCRSGSTAAVPSGGSGASSRANCLTNDSPRSTSPIFTVHLSRASAGKWLVVFLYPPASQTFSSPSSIEQSSSAPPS